MNAWITQMLMLNLVLESSHARNSQMDWQLCALKRPYKYCYITELSSSDNKSPGSIDANSYLLQIFFYAITEYSYEKFIFVNGLSSSQFDAHTEDFSLGLLVPTKERFSA